MTSAATHDRLLDLVDVHRSFQTGPVAVQVLRGVNLRIARGDFAAIMGPSGSGKSTLMHIIGLLDRPTRGRYLLRGQEIGALADDELAALRNATIGFVFQTFHLLPRLNAWQNVGLPLVYRGLDRREIQRRALAMLERVGLQARAAHRPDELSGGQRQRVAIARALVGEPEILLADEPTGALDSQTAEGIMQLLGDLHEAQGMTVIVITHDHAIASQCPRRLRVREGLLEELPPTSLATAPDSLSRSRPQAP